MCDTRDAYDSVLANLARPNKATFVSAILEIARLQPYRFARHPRLRNTCLAKILACRDHPNADADVLDALEMLRVSLWQCLDQDPWVSDEREKEFREAVSLHTLVYSLESTDFCGESFLDSSDESDSDTLHEG